MIFSFHIASVVVTLLEHTPHDFVIHTAPWIPTTGAMERRIRNN